VCFFRIASCSADGIFNRVGTAQCETHSFFVIARRDLNQASYELCPFRGREVEPMAQLDILFFQDFRNPRVTMTDIHGGHAANAIYVLFSVHIPDLVAFPFFDDGRAGPFCEKYVAGMLVSQEVGQSLFIFGCHTF
jgi:hypothetical protein